MQNDLEQIIHLEQSKTVTLVKPHQKLILLNEQHKWAKLCTLIWKTYCHTALDFGHFWSHFVFSK